MQEKLRKKREKTSVMVQDYLFTFFNLGGVKMRIFLPTKYLVISCYKKSS